MSIKNIEPRKIKPTHPGEMLREDFMPDYKLTTSRLAENLGVSQETWIFNVTSNQWIHMNPEVSPPGRSYHKMTFDPENGTMILFGGIKSGYSETYNDTWTYSLEENNWIIHDPQIIEYSPVSGFNFLLILNGLITLYMFSLIRKRKEKP